MEIKQDYYLNKLIEVKEYEYKIKQYHLNYTS